jgi:phosphohistidine phosphatase
VKTLYLLRHAKSSWEAPEVPDHDRPLAPRGQRSAARIADHFKRERIQPALVLSSSARRARLTLRPLQKVFAKSVEVHFESELYAASASELLGRLRSVPEPVPSVMLVGHNPGLQELGLMLARPGSGRDALEGKFPTGALAALQLDVRTWRELAEGAGELTSLTLPRELG